MMNAAKATAVDKLADLVAYSGEDCRDIATVIVEATIEAATRRVFLELENEGRRRSRLDALEVLEQDLCETCVETLSPTPAPPPEGDGTPGSTELEERALFLGWAGRVENLEPDDSTDDEGPRLELVFEIHANLAQRHPLGIAQDLAQAIAALHICDDRDASMVLLELAEAEEAAARAEKTDACLRLLAQVLDPEVAPERISIPNKVALAEMADWTLEELDHTWEWARLAQHAALTPGASPPPMPAVVDAIRRRLKKETTDAE